MTVEEIVAALKAIVEQAEAEDRPLTDEEAERYETLEGQLKAVTRTADIQKRQAAYETPVRSDLHVHVAAGKDDNAELDRAFEHYLRTGIANHDITELRAQEAGTPAEGGYLVSPGFRQKLVEVQKAFGGVSNEVESFSTSTGGSLEFPSLDDTDNVGAITDEEGSFTGGADLVFGQVNLGAFKYTSNGAGNSPLKVSVELLQDSEFDVNGLVSKALGTRIARKQASDWVNGTGTTMPVGLANTGQLSDVVLGTVPSAVSSLTYEDLLEAETALDAAYEANAVWAMSKQTWAKVRSIVGDDERPVIMPSAQAGLDSQPQKTLFGYRVVLDQAFSAINTDANCIAFGDLREAYVIRRVSNLVVLANPYSSANTGQVEYVAWERADGNIQNRSAYVLVGNVDS